MERVNAQIQYSVDNKNQYRWYETVKCNVILLGRTGTGKSTIAYVTEYPGHETDSVTTPVYSEITNVELHEIPLMYRT